MVKNSYCYDMSMVIKKGGSLAELELFLLIATYFLKGVSLEERTSSTEFSIMSLVASNSNSPSTEHFSKLEL